MQVFGKVEAAYVDLMSAGERLRAFDRLFSYKIPCAVISRELEPVWRNAFYDKKAWPSADALESGYEQAGAYSY